MSKRAEKCALFISSKGDGSLSRCLAVSQRLKRLNPIHVSTDPNINAAAKIGAFGEYFQSADDLNCDLANWNVWFTRRISMLCDAFDISCIVVDSEAPHVGALEALSGRRGTRACWIYAGADKQRILHDSPIFDTVFWTPPEPKFKGENPDASNVQLASYPILVNKADLITAEAATRALAVPSGMHSVLLYFERHQSSEFQAAVLAATPLIKQRRTCVFAAHEMAEIGIAELGIRPISVFPSLVAARAFDVVVTSPLAHHRVEIHATGRPVVVASATASPSAIRKSLARLLERRNSRIQQLGPQNGADVIAAQIDQ